MFEEQSRPTTMPSEKVINEVHQLLAKTQKQPVDPGQNSAEQDEAPPSASVLNRLGNLAYRFVDGLRAIPRSYYSDSE